MKKYYLALLCLLFVLIQNGYVSALLIQTETGSDDEKPEFMINMYYKDTQSYPAIASNLNTSFLLWESELQDGSGYGIYGSIIDKDDAAQTAPFPVHTSRYQNQCKPSVATNGTTYLATWQSEHTGNGYDIIARVFDENGSPISDEIIVNSTCLSDQQYPSVASNGTDYLVVWENWSDDGNSCGINGQYVSSDGNKIGSEIHINSDTEGYCMRPSVASCQGTYLVSWYDASAVYAQLLSNSETFIGEQMVISDENSQYIMPTVATNGYDYVICWTAPNNQAGFDTKILSQWVSVEGEAISDTILISDQVTQNGESCSLSLACSGIDLLVTWQNYNGTNWDVYGQLIGSTGIPIGKPNVINKEHDNNECVPSVTHNGLTYTVVWASDAELDSFNIFGQNVRRTVKQGNKEIQVNSTTIGHQRSPAVAATNNTFLAVYENYSRNENQYDVYAQLFDTDFQKLGGEFQINTTSKQHQRYPAVASDGDNFLAVWASYEQDSDEYGIYARLIDNDGTPIGSEIEINTFSNGRQTNPSVIFNGLYYLVVWESYGQEGKASGIYGQLISSTGQPAGGEFRISTLSTDNQQNPALAICGETTCVVWQKYGNPCRVYARLIDQSGNFLSDSIYIGTGEKPSLTANQDHFCIAWQQYTHVSWLFPDTTYPSSGYRVKCRAMSCNGELLGSTDEVSLSFSMNNVDPSVSTDGNDFLVSWASYDNDGMGYEVYGQYYSALMEKIGRTFKLNLTSDQWQQKPTLCTIRNTMYAIWESFAQDMSEFGVYGSILSVDLIRKNNYCLYIPEQIDTLFKYIEVDFMPADFNNDGYFDLQFIEILDNDAYGKKYVYWGTEIDCYSMYTIWNKDGEIIEDMSGGDYGASYISNPAAEYPSYYNSVLGCICYGPIGYFPIPYFEWDTTQIYYNYNICAQMISGNGKLIGSEFYLDPGFVKDQTDPAGTSNGNTYLITWTTGGNTRACMYSSDGQPVVDEFTLESSAVDARSASNGVDFFITWENNSQSNESTGLFAKIISPTNENLRWEYCITNNTEGDQKNASIASNGVRYCAVWESNHSGQNKIYARFFDSSGNAESSEFEVYNKNASPQSSPCIASDGINFILCWKDKCGLWLRYMQYDGALLTDPIRISRTADAFSTASDGTTYFITWERAGDIYGLTISGDGKALQPIQRINEYVNDEQSTPVVGSNGTTYLVSWTSMGIDLNDTGIAGRFFSSNGTPCSSEQRLNTTAEYDQIQPWVVANGLEYFVLWSSLRKFVFIYGTGENVVYRGSYPELDCDGNLDSVPYTLDPVINDDGDFDVFLCFPAKLGESYQVYYSESLDNPAWQEMGPAITGTNTIAALWLNNLPTLIGASEESVDINPQQGYFKVKKQLVNE